tara:strand:- start:906 stop:1013 length:108 start_codon:yes stop_codon:yes gene_type:complete
MITEKEVIEYAKYYYAVKTQLKQTPLNFTQWKQAN